MLLSRERMLDAFLGRDNRFDGRFLTGVVTTGIYCLPSCSARKPKPENVRFYRTEPEARAAGFRPCLRCRPDAVLAGRDPEIELVEAVLAAIRAEPGAFGGVADIARHAGIGATRIEELFRVHRHDSVARVLRRERVRWAMGALLGTKRRLLNVGWDAGWSSASAFHAAFRDVARMTPEAYRRLGRTTAFELALPRPFRAAETLAYLGRDPDSPAERARPGGLARGLTLGATPCVLDVELVGDTARCRVDAAQPVPAERMAEAHRVALRMLGLTGDPAPFERRVRATSELRELIVDREGLRIPLCADPFEALCWSIVGQQVNVSFAASLRRTLIELRGAAVGQGMRAHPTAAAMADLELDDLTARKFSHRKAEYVIGAARAIVAGELDLDALAAGSAVHAERRLVATRGIGPWSAGYVLMRGFGLGDCVLVGDVALRSAVGRFFGLEQRPDENATRACLARFAPHRSLASFHLWRSLGVRA